MACIGLLAATGVQVVWFLQLKHMKGNKNIKLHLWTIIKVCSDVFFSVTSALCHCWNKQGVSCFTQGLNVPTTPRERAQVNFVLSIISTQEASPRWNDQYRTSSRRNEFVGALCASADTSECVNCFQSETTRTQTHTHAHTASLLLQPAWASSEKVSSNFSFSQKWDGMTFVRACFRDNGGDNGVTSYSVAQSSHHNKKRQHLQTRRAAVTVKK